MSLPEGFVVDDDINPPEGFVVDEPKSIGGFGKNVWEDVKGTATGLASLGKGLITKPVDTAIGVISNTPKAIIDEGKRLGIGELITGHPINAIEKFGNAAYDKPLTTTLDVLPALGQVGKALGIGGEAARGLEMASQAGKVASKAAPLELLDDVGRIASKAPEPISLPSEASQILKEAPAAPASVPPAAAAAESVPLGSTFQETVSNLGKKIPEQVKNPLNEVQSFLEEKYGKAAKAPGAIENLGKALEQKSRGMTLKEIGGTPGMARTLRERFGEDALNDLADLAEKKGVTKGFFNWQTGNEIKRLMGDSGKKIGAIRDMAVKRGAVHNTADLVEKIKGELDPIYLKGSGSAQKGAYLKALEDIRRAPKDPVSMAETITEKNRFLKKNRLTQPIGAGTDVLNTASRLNNELIGKFLKPAEAEAYKESLRDFSASKLYDKMYGHTFGRDMMGRSGPSSIWNTVKDIGGRKIMEKVFRNVGRKMQKSPDYFKNPSELTSDVIDSIGDAVDEAISQMGSGEAAH